nr:response regulator [Cohnella zeiphila]
MSVLIVDDDLLARNHLRSLIDWERHGFRICAEAADGAAAQAAIRQHRPDVVLLDVQMPMRNGVEVAKYAREHHEDIQVVMLSSFDSYEYVRETLMNGAVDYLLKHRTDAAALLNVLRTIKNRAKKQLERKENDDRTTRMWTAVSPLVAQSYIRETVTGVSQSGLQELSPLNELERWNNLKLVVAEIPNFDFVTSRYTDIQKNKLLTSISDICQQSIEEYAKGYAAYIEKGRFVLLVSFEKHRSESAIFQELQSMQQRIEQSLRMYLGIHAVSASSSLPNGMSRLADCYQAICGRLERTHRPGEAASGLKADQPIVTLTIRQEKDLLSAIELGDGDQIDGQIERIFEGLNAADSGTVQFVMSELLHVAEKLSGKSGRDTQWVTAEMKEMLSNSRLEPRDFCEWFQSLFQRIARQIHSDGTANSYSPHVREAIGYIHKHYRQAISLEEAASRAGITASYLSRLFKEETGIAFTEYLNRHRIEIGKQLLAEGQTKAKTIYGKIGFNNYSYFIKVFKDIVGMPPQKYAQTTRNPKDPTAKK